MRWLNQVLVVYAAILALVGAQGAFFPREGHTASMISFYAGGGAALLILGTVALSFTNPRPARIGAAVICLLLLGKFGGDFLRTHEFYAEGFITLVTFIVFGCLVAGHFMGMLARRERGRETLPAGFAETQARAREESKSPQSEPKA